MDKVVAHFAAVSAVPLRHPRPRQLIMLTASKACLRHRRIPGGGGGGP